MAGKKILTVGLIGLGVLFFATPEVEAVDVTITVQIQSIGVDVSPTFWNIGVVAAGSTHTSTFTVTNTGNVAEDFLLAVTDPADWTNDTNAATPDNNPGLNEYVLRALFDTTGTHNFADDDRVDDTAQVAHDTSGTRYTDGDASGNNVPAGASRNLYLQFDVPTAGSNTAQQQLTLHVTAQAH
jgi:hypothetical protein